MRVAVLVVALIAVGGAAGCERSPSNADNFTTFAEPGEAPDGWACTERYSLQPLGNTAEVHDDAEPESFSDYVGGVSEVRWSSRERTDDEVRFVATDDEDQVVETLVLNRGDDDRWVETVDLVCF